MLSEGIVFNPNEHIHQTFYTASNLEDAMGYLRATGMLQSGGIFLSDIDNTLRTTREGLGSGKPGRVGKNGMEFVKTLLENGWKFATVSNRPSWLTKIENQIAQGLGYQSVGDLTQNSEFSMFSRHTPFGQSLKGDPQTIELVVAQIDRLIQENPALRDKNIVWMGDSYKDEKFGMSLFQRLLEKGYKGLILIKLPDRLGTHPPLKNDEPQPPTLTRRE